jgi:hypothetical protein
MSATFKESLLATLRAERAEATDIDATYVPVQGITDALLSSDDHIVVGSRGTGKTHALRHLGSQLAQGALGVPVRSDLRLTWDDSFPSVGLPPLTTERAENVVSAILEDIVAQILDFVTVPGGPASGAAALDTIDDLSQTVALAARETQRASADVWARVGASIDAVAATLPGGRLWLLIDEWDSLEDEIAGDVAGVLTRIAHDCDSLTIKCAAGASIGKRTPLLPGTRLDLDEALSVDCSPGDAQQFCEELLFRRIGSQTDGLDRTVLREMLFADSQAGHALSIASNGLPRDLLNLAMRAASYDDAQSISTAGVLRAAEEFYDRDKRHMLPPYLETDLILRWVFERGDDDGRPRAFTLPEFASGSPLLDELEGIRVLRRVPSPHRVNVTPDAGRAYRMDLGCYRVMQSRQGAEPEAEADADSRSAPQDALAPDVIHMYERLLEEQHPEETYQTFLAEHPILLDPQASEIHPKLRLGAEHVTDFAIRAHDDRWLLVEIEKPRDRPVTQGHELSAAFIHAIGQVNDWLTWVDENIAYAQRAMPGIVGARGRLVMGRRSQMTRKAQAKIRTFCLHNAAFEWVAFDDLAAGARKLYRNVHGIDLPPTD